jgi:hypothetical protein
VLFQHYTRFTINNFPCITVKAVNDPVEFFTDQIRAAFRDPEPDDYQLIRLFVARSEVVFCFGLLIYDSC